MSFSLCKYIKKPLTVIIYIEVKNDEIPQAFANFFILKVETIKTEIRVEPSVYNGSKKLFVNLNENFMKELNVKESIKSIKIKNTEGCDRIPKLN